MSLFDGPGILISVPGREALGVAWSASVVEVEEALGALGSIDLRLAISLVSDAARQRGLAVRCAPRPEVFEAPSGKFSVFERARGFGRHVCLSDGETIKQIPGMENHVFFYHPAYRDGMSALARFRRRAPEATLSLSGQINSNLDFGGPSPPIFPSPVFLRPNIPPLGVDPEPRPLFLGAYSTEETVARTVGAQPIDTATEGVCTRLRYAPLTETALGDPVFARLLGHMVLDACFDPTVLMVLRAPFVRGGGGDLAARIETLQDALSKSGVVLPRSRRINVLVADGDLDEDHDLVQRLPMTVYAPDGFDLWRHTPKFYATARRVVVLARGGPGPADDLTTIYGPNAERRRMEESLAE